VKRVDSYKHLGFVTRKLVKAWIDREPSREIPWTRPSVPLAESTVAIISTAGIATAGDRPFDQEGERKNPWWGDPSYRVIPRDATERDVRVYHLHGDRSHAENDLNCVFPLTRLLDLERAGEIGRSAASHYSFMGYILRPDVLLRESTPAMIQGLKRDGVDVVLLAPF